MEALASHRVDGWPSEASVRAFVKADLAEQRARATALVDRRSRRAVPPLVAGVLGLAVLMPLLIAISTIVASLMTSAVMVGAVLLCTYGIGELRLASHERDALDDREFRTRASIDSRWDADRRAIERVVRLSSLEWRRTTPLDPDRDDAAAVLARHLIEDERLRERLQCAPVALGAAHERLVIDASPR